MKPPPFDYVAPRSLTEALSALSDAHGDGKVLAGGQSLVPLLNFRLARPALLVDLNRVPELSYLAWRDGGLALGAMTRDLTIERDERVKRYVPLLAEAMRWVGHPAIRARGTFGGSLAHADPAAELPAVAVCLDGLLTVTSARGTRLIAATDFFTGYLSTALEPDEILTEAWLPISPESTGFAWLEFARRHGDFALVGVAASITLEDENVSAARLVLTGVGGVPVHAREAEAVLVGGPVHERARAAAEAVRSALAPDADLHATSDYRRHLAGVLTERAILMAGERALAAEPAALDVRRALDQLGRHA